MSSSPAPTISRGRQFRLPGLRWGPVLRGIGRVVLGVVIALAIFVALGAVTRMQRASLPAVTGASPVGRTELALTDASRVDPFATDGRNRELAVWIWYPAMPGDQSATAPYFPAAWSQLPSSVPLGQDLSLISTNAHANAALAGRPPVVVLQPGLGQPVGNYSALAEDLASHGYAVIGINETGSADTVFPDGHVVGATPHGGVAEMNIDAWYASAGRVTDVWAADAAFVIHSLEAAPPPIGPLDFTRVAYLGHSLGGASAYQACSGEARCAAAVDLDGTLWTDVRHNGLAAPHLLLQEVPSDTCDTFCSRATADFDTVMSNGSGHRFSIAGAIHQDFGDAGLMPAIADHVGLGSIDPQRLTVIVRDTVRAFLDAYMRAGSPADFVATVSKYPELSVVASR